VQFKQATSVMMGENLLWISMVLWVDGLIDKAMGE
jgi:hypothetical protein